MLGVLNTALTRPLENREFSRTLLESSEHPTHPASEEFRAIPWQYPKIFTDDGKTLYRLPLAVVDIDNDGSKEVVIKTALNGDGRTAEVLTIFRNGEFDTAQVTTREQLSVGQIGGRIPSILYGGLQVRLFALSDVVYLLQYTAKQTQKSRSPSRVTSQTMTVDRYLGGGNVHKGSETTLRTREVCKYRMIRKLHK